jgi:uncharacterized protein YdaU (DUF1376 family)
MAKPDIWMPLYIGDYLADTMHLTTEQHGAYLLLIMGYWRNGGPVSSSDSRLAAMCRLSGDAWSNAKAVLEDFFDTESLPGHWVHGRVDAEMQSAGKNKEKRVVRAKIAAAARWGNAQSNAQSNAQEMLEICPSPSPSPIRSKAKSPLPPKGGGGNGFDLFWKMYPAKKGKPPAQRAWAKAAKSPEIIQQIMQGLANHLTCRQWTKDGGEFIPNPASWLNQERWNDEVSHGPANTERSHPLSAVERVAAKAAERECQRQRVVEEPGDGFIEGEYSRAN